MHYLAAFVRGRVGAGAQYASDIDSLDLGGGGGID